MLKFACALLLLLAAMRAQEVIEMRCSAYKKLLYEEIKTFSFFHADAEEVSFVEDHCKAAGGFIVGGENAMPKEFPFAALVGHAAENGTGDEVSWLCGGTLISESIVLTAAHCFYSPRGIINRVRLGELNYNASNDEADPEDFEVQRLVEHPSYNLELPYDDIGLIMLAKNVSFNSFKHPACLPPPHIEPELQTQLTAIGWGRTEFAAQNSPYLQKVSLQPYSHEECLWLAKGQEGEQRLPKGLSATHICAGSPEIKDTCQGDSGGPLLMQHPDYPCMQLVVGITSIGFSGCATPDVPALYTRVSSYLEWILSYMET